jgi:predicted transcriptional regulator
MAMRKKVTFTLDDDLIARIRVIAQRRQSSVRAMIREYLQELVQSDADEAVQPQQKLGRPSQS